MANNYMPAFPVDYAPEGDTTAVAFWKHIQEILRIYSLLEYLDETKIGSGEVNDFLQQHIDSANPHPNWKPTIDGSQITGTIPADKIVGDLINAYIDASRVRNLEQFIKNTQIPAANVIGDLINATINWNNVTNRPDIGGGTVDKGDGIVASSLGANGYVKFNNGFMIQWGQPTEGGITSVTTNFPAAFPTACHSVVLIPRGDATDADVPRVNSVSASQFTWKAPAGNAGSNRNAFYIAVGS